mgnify:CR=1 FL=1
MHGTIIPCFCQEICYPVWMEKYPYLNEAIAHVLSRRRAELAMSKKKLSEEAMIARIHITALEAGSQSPSMNVVFYLCEALGLTPVDFVSQVMDEVELLKKANKPQSWYV